MGGSHHIVFLVTSEFQAMDLFGPAEAFDAAGTLGGPDYRINVATLSGRAAATEAGIRVSATTGLRDLDSIDTPVLCGGKGPRTQRLNRSQLKTITEAAGRSKRLVSICTAAFLLARAGLASGRRVATHWRYAHDLQREFPDTRVDGDAIFLRDGPVWSSAGVTAGIDLSLALIAEDCGQPVAAAVARQLVIYMHRTGNQAQYSDPLHAQADADERFADLIAWMSNHLGEPLTVEALAERVSLTPRHFSRVFTEHFGVTPGRYVESLRLDQARSLLDEGHARIDQVAHAVGYASDVAFRRAFERRFQMTPTQYRNRFTKPESEHP